MTDLVVRGGWVVTPEGEGVMDIGVEGEQIAFVSPPGVAASGASEIDAAGCIVTPGGIESHAHIHEPMYRGWTGGREVWLQSPEGATRAAAFGGTTTVLSFAFLDVHVTDRAYDTREAVEQRRAIFAGRSYVDFAFHPVLTGSAGPETLASIRSAIAHGTPSFKLFTTDVTTGQAGIRIDPGSMLEAFRVAADAGGLIMVHAEDDDLLKANEARLRREGLNQLVNMRRAHTPEGEALAFTEVARLAEEADAAVYFVHVTAGAALDVVRAERSRGRPVYAETLHNLLCFSDDFYRRTDGARYHIGMGLPNADDQAALWAGVLDSSIATVATDEYTTPYAVKMGGHDIQTVPGGHVGIETRGTILFSEGVQKRAMPLRRFVDLFAANPARLFGLYPRKGVIQPGSDADLAIWDPNVERTISMADLHHDGDYSPWEGWNVGVWPVATILRGRPIVRNGELLSDASFGEWLPRRISPKELASVAGRWAALTVAGLVLNACGAATSATPTPSPMPSLPSDLIAHLDEVTADLNAYWAASDLAGDGYEPPTVRPHRAGELPASVCAEGTDPNDWRQTGYYCFDDSTLTYDADWLAELYEEGPGVATTVLAHEWGHHVQGLTIIPERSLQRELQADCFAGAYLAPTADEPNDISVAEASLRRLVEAGNEEYRQSAWFDIAEHGSPGLRWVSFIIGLLTFSDPSICEGHATYVPRTPEQLGGFVVAHIPGTAYETDADGISITYGDVHLRLEHIAPAAMPPADDTAESQLGAVFGPYSSPMVIHDFTVSDLGAEVRADYGEWLSASYVAETPDRPGAARLGMTRLFRAANGEGLLVDSYSDEPLADLSESALEEAVDDTLTLAYAIENFVCLPGQSSERGSIDYYFACDIEVPE